MRGTAVLSLAQRLLCDVQRRRPGCVSRSPAQSSANLFSWPENANHRVEHALERWFAENANLGHQ